MYCFITFYLIILKQGWSLTKPGAKLAAGKLQESCRNTHSYSTRVAGASRYVETGDLNSGLKGCTAGTLTFWATYFFRLEYKVLGFVMATPYMCHSGWLSCCPIPHYLPTGSLHLIFFLQSSFVCSQHTYSLTLSTPPTQALKVFSQAAQVLSGNCAYRVWCPESGPWTHMVEENWFLKRCLLASNTNTTQIQYKYTCPSPPWYTQ